MPSLRFVAIITLLASAMQGVQSFRMQKKRYGSFGAKARAMWNKYVQDVKDKYPVQDACMPQLHEALPPYQGTVMLFHGFTACPQQFRDLIPMLTSKGFVVLTTLTPGHGGVYRKVWNEKKGQEEVQDNIQFMPVDSKVYEDFGDRMNSIMAKAGGKTVLFGVSLGGAIASYVGAKADYTRQLLTVPLINLAGVSDLAAQILNFYPLSNKTFGWGAPCEVEREAGRAGICQFNLAIGAAARDFGSRHLEQVRGPLPRAKSGGVQVVFVEGDAAVSVGAVQALATKLGVGKDSTSVCGLDAAMGHSFLSPFDNPKENKYWLKEVTRKVANYLVSGTPFAQDGVVAAEDGWPRCQLTCTSTTCPYSFSLVQEDAAENIGEGIEEVGEKKGKDADDDQALWRPKTPAEEEGEAQTKSSYVPIDEMKPGFQCGTEYYFSGEGSLADVVDGAHSWCNSDLVPEEKRVPEFLRGLYWMKDLELPDIAFCPSLGEWDAETRSVRLAVWTHFVFRKTKEEEVPNLAGIVAKLPWPLSKPLIYTITFKDDTFTIADIWTNSKLANTFIKFPLEELSQTDDGSVVSQKKGDIWNRPSYFGLGWKFESKDGRYYAVRVMDDDGTVHRDRYEMMKQAETAQTEAGGSFVRYAAEC